MGALIAASLDKDYPARIVKVISDQSDAAGLEHAREFGITAVAVPRSDFTGKIEHEAAVIAAIEESNAKIVALAGYMRLLSGEFVRRYAGRMINIHPSLLPAFPGLATHERALAAGCRVHGCTVHFVTEGMDEGPIIEQEAVRVELDDTPETLAERVLEAEHRIYPKALAMLARGEVRVTGDGRTLFSP
jgi:phosphoribosylglycinamide formyltransferase-1